MCALTQPMQEISPKQISLLQGLVARGFTPVAFPLYGNAIGIRRGEFAALLVREGEGFRILGQAHYLLNGNPSVRVTRGDRELFVYKDARVEVTAELRAEMKRFEDELARLLRCRS